MTRAAFEKWWYSLPVLTLAPHEIAEDAWRASRTQALEEMAQVVATLRGRVSPAEVIGLERHEAGHNVLDCVLGGLRQLGEKK